MPVTTTPSLSQYERARLYLEKVPGAVAGQEGGLHTWRAVCALVRDFDLPDGEAMELLAEWNGKCSPGWTPRELQSKVRSARLHARNEPGNKLQALNWKERRRQELRRRTTLLPEPEPVELDPESLEPLRGVELLGATPGAAYLAGRGIPLAVAKAAGVLFHPSFYGRPAIVFPVRNESRQIVAGAGRYLDGKEPKARTAGPKSAGVFWTPGALDADADTVIICEAPIDALSLAAVGAPALALNGVSWPSWLPVACAWKRVLLAFDNDTAGDAAAEKFTAALSYTGAKPERLSPAPAKDFNQALEWYGAPALREELAPVVDATPVACELPPVVDATPVACELPPVVDAPGPPMVDGPEGLPEVERRAYWRYWVTIRQEEKRAKRAQRVEPGEWPVVDDYTCQNLPAELSDHEHVISLGGYWTRIEAGPGGERVLTQVLSRH